MFFTVAALKISMWVALVSLFSLSINTNMQSSRPRGFVSFQQKTSRVYFKSIQDVLDQLICYENTVSEATSSGGRVRRRRETVDMVLRDGTSHQKVQMIIDVSFRLEICTSGARATHLTKHDVRKLSHGSPSCESAN